MKDEEILEIALNKAVKGGFSASLAKTYINTPIYELGVMAIIFDHDFAKAFWGKDEVRVEDINPYSPYNDEGTSIGGQVISWEYHLQQMILETEPLQYLKNYL